MMPAGTSTGIALSHDTPAPTASAILSTSHLVRYTMAAGSRPWITRSTPHAIVHWLAASQMSRMERRTKEAFAARSASWPLCTIAALMEQGITPS